MGAITDSGLHEVVETVTMGAVSKSADLRQLLLGGDRRSVAGSRRAHALVTAEPKRIAALAWTRMLAFLREETASA